MERKKVQKTFDYRRGKTGGENLADERIWEDTEFSKYVYEKEGDFKIHAGQHSLNYEETDEYVVYYLTFFDNNYGKPNS